MNSQELLEEKRKKAREASNRYREKLKNNPETKNLLKEKSLKKYYENREKYLENCNKRKRDKYANDPEYRKKILDRENMKVLTEEQRLHKNKRNREYRLKCNDGVIVGRKGGYNITLAERHKEEYLLQKMFLYKIKLIEDDDTIFYKYGLTARLKDRFQKIPYNVEIIEIIETNKYDAIYLEIEKLSIVNNYIPKKLFKGYTECFIEN